MTIEKSPEWLAERRTGVGGSDAAVVVLGEYYGKTAHDLYLEKTGLVQSPNLDTPDIRRGNRQEPVAAMVFEELTGLRVQVMPEMLRHASRPYMIAHLDRLILPDEDVLEIKCPRMMTYRKYQLEGIPEGIQIQGQHELAVKTGAKRVVFGIFAAELDEMMVVPIERDEELIDMIQEIEARFWEQVQAQEWHEGSPVVKSLDLPPIGGELYRIENSAWSTAAEALRAAHDLKAEIEALETDSKSQILSLMGEHQVVEGAGLRVYYKFQNGRETLDKAALLADHPELDLKKYMKCGDPFRTFRPFFLGEK